MISMDSFSDYIFLEKLNDDYVSALKNEEEAKLRLLNAQKEVRSKANSLRKEADILSLKEYVLSRWLGDKSCSLQDLLSSSKSLNTKERNEIIKSLGLKLVTYTVSEYEYWEDEYGSSHSKPAVYGHRLEKA